VDEPHDDADSCVIRGGRVNARANHYPVIE
jgi:hypothetical protein